MRGCWLTAIGAWAALGVMSCGPAGADQPRQVEIREYQGEKLGSAADFRENSIRGPQAVDSATYRLTVSGLVEQELALGLAELLALPQEQRLVTIYCVEGWSVRILWEGIRLVGLLDSAGVDSAASVVIFRAVDGYTTSLPLGFVRDRDLLLAHRMNGIVLPAANGYPLQLVAEDKWGYKWIRWVDRIELSSDTGFRGFWESRGYNQDGSLSGPKREPSP